MGMHEIREKYDRIFNLKIGNNKGPGMIIGLKYEFSDEDIPFEVIGFNTPINYTHSVSLSQSLGGAHYRLDIPYKNMDVHVTFRAHSHGVVLTVPKSEVPISLEEISYEKAADVLKQTRSLRGKIVDYQGVLEERIMRAALEGYKPLRKKSE